jgi:hypothetical protein
MLHSVILGPLVAALGSDGTAGGNNMGGEGSRDGEAVDSDIQQNSESAGVDIHDAMALEDIRVGRVVEQWPDCRDLVVATGLVAAGAADLEVSPCSASIEPVAWRLEPISERKGVSHISVHGDRRPLRINFVLTSLPCC